MTTTTHPSTSIDLVRFVLTHIDADEAELKRMSRRRAAPQQQSRRSPAACAASDANSTRSIPNVGSWAASNA